jgi:hypothetical protein
MDIEAVKGDTEYYDLAAKRKTGVISLVGLNVKAWFTAKRTKEDIDADAVILLNSETHPTQVVFTDRPAGLFFVQLLPEDTVDIEEDSLVFDVQVREQDGRVTTVSRGNLLLVQDITRAVI